VIVLADRGLYAQWLFAAIQALGWHPLLRVNAGGTFRPAGWVHRYPLTHWTPAVGRRWQGRGTAFAGKKTAWTVPCWPMRAPGIKSRGCSSPICRPRPPTPVGTGCAPGSNRASEKQGGRLTVALYPDDRSPAGRTAVVGPRHRDLVGAGGRRGSRSPPAARHVSGHARLAAPVRPTLAVGRYLPPWVVVDRGGALQSPAVASRSRLPGTLARHAQRPEQPAITSARR